MEFTPYLVWNVIITLVVAPLLYNIRQNTAELKRQDILLNKTREDIAKNYVTKIEVKDEMEQVMDRLEKLGEKIDKIFEIIYNKGKSG
tara:strand:+ start:140 stop:403 length:264 start_codon:yes stop_codon:yes gene_type:complete